MNRYLVTLVPLEPYFLGGERNFDFGGTKRAMKQSYFIRSQTTPAQTTLLGALRYAILQVNDALITDFANQTQIRRAAELVGPESFAFDVDRDFGVIGSMSPLFIIDQDHYLIPAPMNHQNGAKAYEPMQVEFCHGLSLSCGGGLVAANYNAKNGCGSGWLDLHRGKVLPEGELFEGIVRVGINAQRTEGIPDDESSFFKKEYQRLRRGAFAFFARLERSTAEKLAQGLRVFLGQNKSAFILRAWERENDLNALISGALAGKSRLPFWYAPGDCRLSENLSGFHIAQPRLFRHLTTSTDHRYYYRINKSEKLYRLARAGAVFYGAEPEFPRDLICRKIGMNHLIYIGGQ